MVHGTIVAEERKNKGGLGRVWSGRVQVGSGRAVERCSLPGPSPHFFFAPPWLSRRLLGSSFDRLNASSRLCCHSINCHKNAVMQHITECYIYFLRVGNRTTYYERGIGKKYMKPSVVYVTTLIVIMVVFRKKPIQNPGKITWYWWKETLPKEVFEMLPDRVESALQPLPHVCDHNSDKFWYHSIG